MISAKKKAQKSTTAMKANGKSCTDKKTHLETEIRF